MMIMKTKQKHHIFFSVSASVLTLFITSCTAPIAKENRSSYPQALPDVTMPETNIPPTFNNTPVQATVPQVPPISHYYDPYALNRSNKEVVQPLPKEYRLPAQYPVPVNVVPPRSTVPQIRTTTKATVDKVFEQAAAAKKIQPKPEVPAIAIAAAPRPRLPVTVAEVKDTASDPYQSIPDRAPKMLLAKAAPSSLPSSKNTAGKSGATNSATSPAVMALLIKARTDLGNDKHDVAISRLERALRIDSDNAIIWNDLAKAYYQKGNYTQAMAMAKKANSYSKAGSSVANSNWLIIKNAASKSGNVTALRQALQYQAANR